MDLGEECNSRGLLVLNPSVCDGRRDARNLVRKYRNRRGSRCCFTLSEKGACVLRAHMIQGLRPIGESRLSVPFGDFQKLDTGVFCVRYVLLEEAFHHVVHDGFF